MSRREGELLRGPRRGPGPAALLKRSVAVLGECGDLVLHVPRESVDGEAPGYYGLPFKAGRLLCATADGRAGYILRPYLDAGRASSRQLARRSAVHAFDLHERFMGRAADAYYNLVVPQFERPKYAGDLACIHYFADKDLGDGDEGGEVEWVHWFNGPDGPAYVPIYDVGHGQFYIPPGAWYVGDDGIDYFDEATGAGGTSDEA